MLEARSVAVLGASVKPATLGAQMIAELRRGGFTGQIFPVNPGYDEVDGLPCFPSVADIGEPVDMAILGLANARIEQAMRDCAAAGVAGVVTFASLYEEEPPEPGMPPLMQRLRAIADTHAMAMCGGNGMGFMNEEHHVRATGFLTPEELRHGPVTFLSHSGSAFAALAFNDRGIGFNLIVSSGQEVVSTLADYMEYSLGLESTRVLALLLETVRDPDKFRRQLERAAEREVPVLALKVGRTEGSKALVTAHSGALAGEHGAYEALFEAYGVHELRSLDEMADTMELFSSPRRVRGGRGIATVHDSGGERAMFVDLAAEHDVPFAQISAATRARIQDTLDPGMEAVNPFDAWGTGIDADRIFAEAFAAFADDPDTAVVSFVVDLTEQGPPYDEGYIQLARDGHAATDKPFCLLSNLSAAVSRHEAQMLRDAGIPVLEGTTPGLRALKHLIDDRDFRERAASVPPAPVADDVRARWRDRLTSEEELLELDGLTMLAEYGVPTVAALAAQSANEAVAAADAIGYPVVLKTAMPGTLHKSDVGGVVLGLGDADAVRNAYGDLAARLGPSVAVAATAPSGVEVALGVVRDPTFGPLVLVAAGGILVELLQDRRLGLPPLDVPRAAAMVDALRMRPLLDGVRGAPPADVAALAAAVSRLSVLAADLGDLVQALDVNPLIVSPNGCVAVDALVVAGSA
jgi:acyl-CoA synthetase (NDP forming)